MAHTNKKIALLTLYIGGNLGDAAIQEAVIANLRKRFPLAEFLLITLCPEAVKELHGISSFPITHFVIKNYSPGPTYRLHKEKLDSNQPSRYDNKPFAPARHQEEKRSDRFKAKSESFLYSLALKCRRLLSLVKGELGHIFRSYKVMKQSSVLIVSGGGQLDDYWGGAWGGTHMHY